MPKRQVSTPDSARIHPCAAAAHRIAELQDEIRDLRLANEILRRVACSLAGVDPDDRRPEH